MSSPDVETRLAVLERQVARLMETLKDPESIASLREALDDVEHGRHRPVEEVFEEMRVKNNIPRA